MIQASVFLMKINLSLRADFQSNSKKSNISVVYFEVQF